MSGAKYTPGADALAAWREGILSGEPPVRYPVGLGDLERFEVRPGEVVLLGGAPGAGKTAFVMQVTLDALRLTEDLRALVCNVEMSPGVLLDRQFARVSGIDLDTVRGRRFGPEHAERLEVAFATLEPLMDRLCFLGPPYSLTNVAETVDDFGAGLLVIDYIQRVEAASKHDTERHAVNETMGLLRQFADGGQAVLVLSAVGRGRDRKGRSSYAGEGLSLASFRESSELEFGADNAWLLDPDEEPNPQSVTLRHLKARHAEPQNIVLDFDGRLQRFTPKGGAPAPGRSPVEQTRIREELLRLWDNARSAAEEGNE